MKRITALLTVTLFVLSALTACADNNSAQKSADARTEKTELVVFAAASMTETLNEIAELYSKVAPDVKLTFNFDSSGTLKTQIEEGAVCDLFISAAQKQMNELEKAGSINSDTRVDLLENKVALCVADNSKKEIKSYDDMKAYLEAGDILMAIGNEDVPVGQYTQKIFDFYKLDEESLAKKGLLTYGSNVKEVTTQVAEGTVDCGIIYQTDAYSAKLKVADTATEDMCGQVIYPAAVLAKSKHTEEAKALLDYLRKADSSEIFSKVGFTPLS